MKLHRKKLPNDPALLKQMFFDVQDKYETVKDKLQTIQNKYKNTSIEFENKKQDFQKEKEVFINEIENYKTRLKESELYSEWLEERVAAVEYKLYGKKSEKLNLLNKDQFFLFNEAETFAEVDEVQEDKIKIRSYIRHKRGRKPLPDFLKRKEVIHDLPPEEKKCPCCGRERKFLGSDTSEDIEFYPARIKVIRHRVMKYGECNCEDFVNSGLPGVISAKKPPRLIPGSIASASILAQVITAKYADGLPFYRQSKIFKRFEIDISRSTMCNWTLLAAEKCKKLIDLLKTDIQSCPVIQMDETTLQVLREPGRPPNTKSYMWVILGRSAEQRLAVLFIYDPSRSGNVAEEILGDFNGFLQTDGYAGYNKAGSENGRKHVSCLAHIRRKFYTIIESSKKNNIRVKSAEKAMDFITKIYQIENSLRKRDLSPEKFVKLRKEKMLPLLEKFSDWLLLKQTEVPPSSSIGRAVNYALKEWKKFTGFLESALLTPDNNLAENAIRPFVIGRKNWLFSNTPRGANASAAMYSLIETAKLNGLEPFKYLNYIFEKLPLTETDEELRKLLPYNVNVEEIEKAVDSDG
ncbi:MAG: IS66 family transposase [Spirochaetes bacterium]|nr:IS66 family transposase [Spirochaetota bacterium]